MPAPRHPLPRPDYADRFHCIGPECEDTCCAGWAIHMDQAALERIEAEAPEPLRTQVHAGLTPDAGRFLLTPDGDCPMLTSARLCHIQAATSHDLLPLGCQSFPRIHIQLDDTRETSLNLSCPEAARLVLANAELFDALKASLPTPAAALAALRRAAASKAGKADRATAGNLRLLFWPLRSLLLATLFDRSLNLTTRIHRLAAFAGALAEPRAFLSPNAAARTDSLAERFAGVSRLPSLPDLLPPLAVLLHSLDQLLAANPHNKRLRALVSTILIAIAFDPAHPERSAEAYHAAFHAYATPFLEAHPWLFEHYFANSIFRNLYPWGWTEPQTAAAFVESARQLEARYLLLLGTVVGLAARHGAALAEAHVIDAMQSLTRGFEHAQPRASLLPVAGLTGGDQLPVAAAQWPPAAATTTHPAPA